MQFGNITIRSQYKVANTKQCGSSSNNSSSITIYGSSSSSSSSRNSSSSSSSSSIVAAAAAIERAMADVHNIGKISKKTGPSS